MESPLFPHVQYPAPYILNSFCNSSSDSLIKKWCLNCVNLFPTFFKSAAIASN